MKLQWNPIPILLHLFLLQITLSTAFSPSPMNCTDTTRMCTSFLAFKPEPNETLPVIQSLLPKINNSVSGVKSGGAEPVLQACLFGEGSGGSHSSPSRGFTTGSADFGSKLRTAQNELENEPYMVGKLRMSIFWSISRIVNIIFLEEVMAVLTLKGFQDAEQFVTALKAINPIKLPAKTDAAKNKSADTYSNIKGNGIKDED